MATLASQWMQEGIKQGLEQGLEQGRQVVLDSLHFGLLTRFGTKGDHLMTEVVEVKDFAQLQKMIESLFIVSTPEEFRNRCQNIVNNKTVTDAHLN